MGGKLLISIGRGVLYGFSRLKGSFNKQLLSLLTLENKPLPNTTQSTPLYLLKLLEQGPKNHLAIRSTPKVVVLKVSMHCNGCARKVQKHVSKMEGVISCKINLEKKMMVMTGDVVPLPVMKSLSKVKTTELWDSTQTDTAQDNSITTSTT